MFLPPSVQSVSSRNSKEELLPHPAANNVQVKQVSQPKEPVYHPPTLNQKPFQPPVTSEPPSNINHEAADFRPPEAVQPPYQPPAVNNFPVQYQQQSRVSQPSRPPQVSRQQSVEQNMKGLNLRDFSKVWVSFSILKLKTKPATFWKKLISVVRKAYRKEHAFHTLYIISRVRTTNLSYTTL